jgi:hypothetical protein
VVAGISMATTIVAGGSHTCATLDDQTIRCWGDNFEGQLGDGSHGNVQSAPVTVSGISTAAAIAAGTFHTCTVQTDGTASCWGLNNRGQLGDDTTMNRDTPVQVSFILKTPFTDIATSIYETNIEWVYQAGITAGCSPTLFCPDASVTRGQVASFLARALHLSGPAPDAFTDDETSVHEPNINLVAQAGIAAGCAATKFCPEGRVSREQMASFLARALHLSGFAPDAFTDDETSIHEPNINLIAREGIATGCRESDFCPATNVTRGQMAAFLHRAFGP